MDNLLLRVSWKIYSVCGPRCIGPLLFLSFLLCSYVLWFAFTVGRKLISQIPFFRRAFSLDAFLGLLSRISGFCRQYAKDGVYNVLNLLFSDSEPKQNEYGGKLGLESIEQSKRKSFFRRRPRKEDIRMLGFSNSMVIRQEKEKETAPLKNGVSRITQSQAVKVADKYGILFRNVTEKGKKCQLDKKEDDKGKKILQESPGERKTAQKNQNVLKTSPETFKTNNQEPQKECESPLVPVDRWQKSVSRIIKKEEETENKPKPSKTPSLCQSKDLSKRFSKGQISAPSQPNPTVRYRELRMDNNPMMPVRKVCTFFLKGICNREKNCNFMHYWPGDLCPQFLRNGCMREGCSLVHADTENRIFVQENGRLRREREWYEMRPNLIAPTQRHYAFPILRNATYMASRRALVQDYGPLN